MGDRLPADCGVTTSGNKFIVSYKVGKNVDKKNVTWQWKEAEGGNFVASMEAKRENGDVRFHNSAPVPADVHSKLEKKGESKDGDFYKVELKKKASDVPDIGKYFDVPQQ